ncbi:MAG: RNA methyltransferase [Pseudomonadota bacterium]
MQRDQFITKPNSAFQQLEALKLSRTKRSKTGQVFVEGVIPVNLLLESGTEVTGVYTNADVSLSDWAQDVSERASGSQRFHVSSELMSQLSDRDSPSELILTATRPTWVSNALEVDRLLIMDRPTSPGNLGTVIRTCDAFGIDAIFLFGRAADPFDPKCIAASRGTVFSQKTSVLESKHALEALIDRCRSRDRFTLYGSSSKEGKSLSAISATDRFGLIVGNETKGMSSYLAALVDQMVTIPMRGNATSLNLAAATSVLLYGLSGTL